MLSTEEFCIGSAIWEPVVSFKVDRTLRILEAVNSMDEIEVLILYPVWCFEGSIYTLMTLYHS